MTTDIGLNTIKSLSIVVTRMFFGGTMQVTSYYQALLFRFSDLNRQHDHILFRGISLTFTHPFAFTVVFVCFAMILLDHSGYTSSDHTKDEARWLQDKWDRSANDNDRTNYQKEREDGLGRERAPSWMSPSSPAGGGTSGGNGSGSGGGFAGGSGGGGGGSG